MVMMHEREIFSALYKTLIFNLCFLLSFTMFIKCYIDCWTSCFECLESNCKEIKCFIVSFLFYLQFKELTYGLQKTNASTLLRSCLEYVMNHYSRFLPGEGGYQLDLLQDVSFFITNKLLFPFPLLPLLCFVFFIRFGQKFWVSNPHQHLTSNKAREVSEKKNITT